MSVAEELELELRVQELVEAADGVRLIRLAHPDGRDLPAWTPGSHIDLHAGDLVRQYSLCGEPSDASRWSIAVLREAESRGGSSYVHDKLTEGDAVTVRGPRNHFALAPGTGYRFLAGGIGITPILPMLAAAEAAGARWRLDYGGRSRASMAFADDLVAAYGDRVRLHPQDEVGLMPLPQILADPQPGELVYCCGPTPLLAAVDQACASWPSGALHVEHFSPKVVEASATDTFEVELRDSAVTLTVPADRSILDVVREAGIEPLTSCEEGTCGTCETGVLEGVVDHRDSILTPAEQAANDVMYICVSRAAGGCPRLVLEL